MFYYAFSFFISRILSKKAAMFFSAGCGAVAVSATDASAPSAVVAAATAVVVAAADAFFTVALFYIRLISVQASF